jgi:aromatic ring-opening dioxygenase LigB subunit
MIVFAALIPNSPLLVKRSGNTAEKTIAAIADIEQQMEKTQPETLLIISQEAKHFPSTYTLLHADKFTESLKRLGFISEHLTYPADIELLAKLHTFSRHEKIPLRSVHSELLDKGSGLALRMLKSQKRKYNIITIGSSDQSVQNHYDFGHQLKELLHSSPRRIAIIVTGDAGSETTARGMIASLANRSIPTLVHTAESNGPDAETLCRPLAVGYGLLHNFPLETHITCDEIFSDHSLISAVLFSD